MAIFLCYDVSLSEDDWEILYFIWPFMKHLTGYIHDWEIDISMKHDDWMTINGHFHIPFIFGSIDVPSEDTSGW